MQFYLDLAENAAIVFTGLKTLSTMTPNKHPNKYLNFLFNLLNLLALNIGHDKNAN